MATKSLWLALNGPFFFSFAWMGLQNNPLTLKGPILVAVKVFYSLDGQLLAESAVHWDLIRVFRVRNLHRISCKGNFVEIEN